MKNLTLALGGLAAMTWAMRGPRSGADPSRSTGRAAEPADAKGPGLPGVFCGA